MRIAATFLLVTTFYGFHVGAQSRDLVISDLQQYCTADDPGLELGCRYYIWGIAEAANIRPADWGMLNIPADRSRIICLPVGVKASDVEKVVKLRIGELLMLYPKDKDGGALGIVLGTLIAEYPC